MLEKVWDIFSLLPELVERNMKPGSFGEISPHAVVSDNVHIGKGTRILPGTYITGPAIIGENCIVGPNAFVRQNVVLADGVQVGHVCEVKNALLLEGAIVPHFAYVGDSILGIKAHLGAGVKLSNVRIDGKSIPVNINGQKHDTGLPKFGAVLGDGVEVGCNAVLNPGTMVAPNTLISGCTLAGGYYSEGSFVVHGHRPEIR